MEHKNIDIAFLQETHSSSDNVVDWMKEFSGIPVLSHSSTLSGGVAILFSRNFKPISYDVNEIIKGRLLKVRATYETFVFVFICIYAPTAPVERLLFLDTLCSTLQNCCTEEFLFLGGDFNCAELDIDRNHVEPHMASRKHLIHLIEKYDLCDVWRAQNGNERQYTWAHARDNCLSLARLDGFYVFKHHLNMFNKCYITPLSFSDHNMVSCKCLLNSVKPKSAYWHFNTNLLNDKFFFESFKAFWEVFKKTKSSFKSLQQWWDYGKVQIKQFAQQYTRNVTKDLTRSLEVLEKQIMDLQKLTQTSGDVNCLETFLRKKAELKDLLDYKTQGALVRAKFLNIDQMDAPKYFFVHERKNGQKRIIHALRSEDGILVSNPREIREEAMRFYQSLYGSELELEDGGINVFLENLPKISEESNAELESALTLGELYGALQSMESGKTPGMDGLPVDFLKTFWSEIGVDLLEVLNDSLLKGGLPLSCRRAVVTLLPKKRRSH